MPRRAGERTHRRRSRPCAAWPRGSGLSMRTSRAPRRSCAIASCRSRTSPIPASRPARKGKGRRSRSGVPRVRARYRRTGSSGRRTAIWIPAARRCRGARRQSLDIERGAKIAGSGFPLLVGGGARLSRALVQFMLDLHVREHGYLEVLPPLVVSRDSMTGTGSHPQVRGRCLPDGSRRPLPRAHGRSAPHESAPGRDPVRGRPAAGVCRAHALLPARGRRRGPRYARAPAGASVRQGGDRPHLSARGVGGATGASYPPRGAGARAPGSPVPAGSAPAGRSRIRERDHVRPGDMGSRRRGMARSVQLLVVRGFPGAALRYPLPARRAGDAPCTCTR